MPHVTDELREAVQACNDDKANTRRIQGAVPVLASAMTRKYAQLWTNHELMAS